MTGGVWHSPAPCTGDATWTELSELVSSGEVLLHGSTTGGLTTLEPRAPLDFSLDDYSKSVAVFATEDPTWAIAYAVRSGACRGFLNACFYPGPSAGNREKRRIFLSYAATDDGVMPTAPGFVYVLSRDSFTRMPSYTDPGLGPITECQWVSSTAVQVLAEVPVTAANLPLTPRLHDHATVARRAASDPNGFPWLDQPAGPSQPFT